MIEIEKAVPIPPKCNVKTKYPCAAMEIGDSFFVPMEDKKRNAFCSSISLRVRSLRPKVFTARAVAGGVRVWRVE
jgi:hypothetical protein